MDKHVRTTVNKLLDTLPVGSKWETRFVRRLHYKLYDGEGNAVETYEPKPIELIALDSICHRYRDNLDGMHFCTPRCEQYELPKSEKWIQEQLFDPDRFKGEPSYMQHPTQVRLEL